jgi:hypothetical protein
MTLGDRGIILANDAGTLQEGIRRLNAGVDAEKMRADASTQ